MKRAQRRPSGNESSCATSCGEKKISQSRYTIAKHVKTCISDYNRRVAEKEELVKSRHDDRKYHSDDPRPYGRSGHRGVVRVSDGRTNLCISSVRIRGTSRRGKQTWIRRVVLKTYSILVEVRILELGHDCVVVEDMALLDINLLVRGRKAGNLGRRHSANTTTVNSGLGPGKRDLGPGDLGRGRFTSAEARRV